MGGGSSNATGLTAFLARCHGSAGGRISPASGPGRLPRKMGSSLSRASTVVKVPTLLSRSSPAPSALLSFPLVGQLVSTVRTVVGNVKQRGNGALVLTPADVEPIGKVLDQFHPENLGMVAPIYQHIRPRTDFPDDIRYINICEEADWHVGIFVLPPGGRIPLHDHPGMCVLSRLLCGSLHVKSFDWCSSPTSEGRRGVRGMSRASMTAKLHTDQWFKEPCTLSLFSKAGNVHEFMAGDDGCAILDVLVPPYDPMEGRPCNYYRAIPSPTPPGEGAAAVGQQVKKEEEEVGGLYRLVEVDEPEDLEVINGEYAGPSPPTPPGRK